MVDADTASAHAARIYKALQRVESHFPDSPAVHHLHEVLGDAWKVWQAAVPGTVQPFDGTAKPNP